MMPAMPRPELAAHANVANKEVLYDIWMISSWIRA
jgi:hypothetical protein